MVIYKLLFRLDKEHDVSCSCMTEKCENQRSFSCFITFLTLICCYNFLNLHFLGTHECLPTRQHGERGVAGPVYLLWENWKWDHRDAAGKIWTRWELSAERQRNSARGLLSVCEVSCECDDRTGSNEGFFIQLCCTVMSLLDHSLFISEYTENVFTVTYCNCANVRVSTEYLHKIFVQY